MHPSDEPTFSVPRGFMEMHILRILDIPRHGYEIIKLMEGECAYWKPSPGSVYPMLRKLQKAGLITEKDVGNRKVYTLTKSGRERLKRFDAYKKGIADKINALISMIGEHPEGIDKGLEIFERIRGDPEKFRRAARLKEKFLHDMRELAEE